jgi:hypothetical protein
MAIDFLLDDGNDLQFSAGDISLGESDLQEVGLIIQSHQGEWKNDPIAGLGLTRFIKSAENRLAIDRLLKIQLMRDDKNYNDIKKRIEFKFQTNA